MPDMIAERTLELTLPSGTQESIRVRVWAPQYRPRPSAPFWEADVEVAGAGKAHKTQGVGVDAFQALYSALFLIPAMLAIYEDDGRLSWLDEPRLGFPEFKLTAP
ncbi:hypothetical protein WMF26_06350 [Sorangium sp. So ce185]|uniref:DUF6968 family protein n=1 Tax=Sorangium sp. So ce185 TaxID=3133287 RepID=UPI003F631E13